MSRQVIDAHFHLWDLERFVYPWLRSPGAENLQWSYVLDDWSADTSGVDVVAAVHVQAEMDHSHDPVAETAWLDSLTSGGPDLRTPLVCVGYADLRVPDLDEILDRHSEFELFRGVRQEVWFDPDSVRADVPRTNLLDDPRWAAGLRQLDKRGLTFDLLAWPSQLEQAARIFRDLPELAVVVEHAGLPVDAAPDRRAQWRSALRLFADQVPRSSLKLSALSFVSPHWDRPAIAEVFTDALAIFGPRRCLLGSNFPVDRPSVTYEQLWSDYEAFAAALSSAERDQLFRDNAAAVYGIDLASPAASRGTS